MAGRERLDRPAEGTDRPALILTRPRASRGAEDLEQMRASLMAEIDATLDIPDRIGWCYDLDQRLPDGTTPRECLDRFDPRRANLPEISGEQARRYIEEHRSSRPWLQRAADRCESVQRVFASLDQGSGHALERHEGFADDDKLMRRVGRLEDPAQLDPVKRAHGIDGCKQGDQPHKCNHIATAIQDPDAFAAALARGVADDRVRSALDRPFQHGPPPNAAVISIEELLGPGGHRNCSGFRLADLDGSTSKARANRKTWVEQRANGMTSELPEPRVLPIKSLQHASVVFHFKADHVRGCWSVLTIYVDPIEDQLEGS